VVQYKNVAMFSNVLAFLLRCNAKRFSKQQSRIVSSRMNKTASRAFASRGTTQYKNSVGANKNVSNSKL
jgi:hypothetical protein